MRGVPLPLPGSFEFNLMAEGIRREKEEKVAFIRTLLLAFASAGSADMEEINQLFIEYVEEVYQFKYNFKYQPVRRRKVTKAIDQQLEDLRILKQVAAM